MGLQEQQDPQMQRLQQLMSSPLADSLFQMFGGAPTRFGPETNYYNLGSFIRSRDSISIAPDAMGPHWFPRVLSHELAHRSIPIEDVAATKEGSIERAILERASEFGPHTPYIPQNRFEHLAEAFENAVRVLRSPTKLQEDMLKLLDYEIPGTKEAVDYLLEQPILKDHFLNQLKKMQEREKPEPTARDATNIKPKVDPSD